MMSVKKHRRAAQTVRLLVLCGVGSLLALGCGSDETKQGQRMTRGDDVIVTTFYPTTWMAEQIVGDLVKVDCPLPDGEDPIFWNPGDEAITKYQSAKLIVTNGAGFEKWLDKVTLPASRVVDTTAGLSEPFIQYENAITHQHGPSGEHSHEGIDGHTWPDPIIAKHQASRIAEAAAKAWPEHSDAIEGNLKSLLGKFDELDQELKELSPQLEGKRVLCSHPAYNYLARRYEWKIENLDLDPEQPIADELMAAWAKDQAEKTTILLWEGQPLDETIQKLEAIGITSIVFSPCESKPEQGDYFSAMMASIELLHNATPSAQ